MNQNFNEEGETRTGCFSDDNSNIQFIVGPVCPRCHSNNYARNNIFGYTNCVCSDCGMKYHYDFNN